MATPNTFSTLTSPKGLHLDARGIAPADLMPEALLLVASTQAGFVPGDEPQIRVPFVSLDGQPGFVAEGAEIPQTEPESRDVAISTGKIACLIAVSREQYNQGDAATMISDAMRRALIRKANAAFLSQVAPTGGKRVPPAGLTAQGLTNGGNLGASLDVFADALATIEGAGGVANFVLAAPAAWAAISKLKSGTDRNDSLIGAGVDAAQRSLLGVPVFVDRDVPADSIIVGDRAAVLSAYGNVDLAASEDYLFDKDSIAVRATMRLGAVVADVARVVQIGVAAPAQSGGATGGTG